MSPIPMWTKLRELAPALTFLLAAIGFGVFLTLAGGCDPAGHIKVRVPVEVQQTEGTPPVVTLRRAYDLKSEFALRNRNAMREFDENIQDAEALAAWWTSFITTGLESPEVQGAAAAIPGGSLVLAGLTSLAGLLFGRQTGKTKGILATARPIETARDRALEDKLRIESGRNLLVIDKSISGPIHAANGAGRVIRERVGA